MVKKDDILFMLTEEAMPATKKQSWMLELGEVEGNMYTCNTYEIV